MEHLKSRLVILFGFILSIGVSAQSGCNITVDAGPDITICEGGSGNLSGRVSGNYDEYEWSPSTGLGNPRDLNTSVSVSTPTVYTLTARGEGSNLIVNGGIETGGLAPSSTSFNYVAIPDLPLSPGGSYTVGSSVNFGNYWGCSVHSGTYAMAYHGTGAAGANIWCQTVAVQPNTDYKLEAWLMSVVIPLITTAPSISVQVNGSVVASTTGSPTLNCSWSSATGIWNSGGSTSANVCIINNNGARNFGGLDDISMIECCVITDEVLVDIERVEAVIAPNGPITCDNPQLILDATGSTSGPGYRYEWTTNDGLIISGFNTLMPTIGKPGTYRLKVTSPNGCEKEAEIMIEGSVTPPDLRTIDATLSCENSPVWVIATSTDPTVRFKWTGPNGFSSLDPSFTTTTGGVYYVRVEDAYNCFSVDSVIVADTRSYPNISIAGDTLSCGNDSIELDSESDSWKLQYVWTGPDGQKYRQKVLTTGDTGTYILTVIDSNKCESADTFRVIEIDLDFDVFATADTITCEDPVAFLRGNSDSSNVDYKWTGPNGFSAMGKEVMVTDSGTYVMVATYDSLCSKTDTIKVIKADDVPDISILGDTLNCLDDTAQLKGLSSSPGAQLSWTGPNGFTSNDSLISVTSGGTYILEVIGTNGCIITESFEVRTDTVKPTFAISGGQLSCQIDTVLLEVTGSPGKSAIIWRIPDGSSFTGMMIEAWQQGQYVVEVTAQNGCQAKDSFNLVSIDTAPQIFLGDDTLTCLKDEVILDASHDDIIGWTWSGPGGFTSKDSIITTDVPGTYDLLAKAVDGCDTSLSVNITLDTMSPELMIEADTIDCNQNRAQISVTTDDTTGTAKWTGPKGFTSELLSPVAPDSGWYQIKYTLPNGCSTTDSIYVHRIRDIPELVADHDTITCTRDSAVLTVTSSSPGIRIEWRDENDQLVGTSAQIVVRQGGEYTAVGLTRAGCITTTTVNVSVDTVRPEIIGIQSEGLQCDSLFTTLDATPGPDVVALEWRGPGSFSSMEEDPRVSDIGWYYLTVYAENGCQSTDSIFLVAQDTKPDAIASADTLSCRKDSAYLYGRSSSPDVAYIWTGPGNFSSTDSVTLAPGPGIYYLTVRDINDCSTVDSVKVTEDYSTASSDLRADSLRCSGSTAQVEAMTVPANSFHDWYRNGTIIGNGADIEVSQTGKYVLITEHPESGCRDTSEIEVIRSSDTITDVRLSTKDIDCTNDQGSITVVDVLGSQGPYEFALDGRPFTSSGDFTSVTAGDHLLTVRDIFGCTFDRAVEILSEADYELVLGADFTINKGESRPIPGMTDIPDSLLVSVIWSPTTGLSCDDCLFPAAMPEMTTTYLLVIKDSNGCIYRDDITIEVVVDESIFFPNSFSPNGDQINDVLTIMTREEVPLLSLAIYDRWGERVFLSENGVTNDPDFGWKGTFHDQQAPQGVYVYIARVLINDREVVLRGSVTLIR